MTPANEARRICPFRVASWNWCSTPTVQSMHVRDWAWRPIRYKLLLFVDSTLLCTCIVEIMSTCQPCRKEGVPCSTATSVVCVPPDLRLKGQ